MMVHAPVITLSVMSATEAWQELPLCLASSWQCTADLGSTESRGCEHASNSEQQYCSVVAREITLRCFGHLEMGSCDVVTKVRP